MTRRAKPLDDADLLARIAERVEGLGDEDIVGLRDALNIEIERRTRLAEIEASEALNRANFWATALGRQVHIERHVHGPTGKRLSTHTLAPAVVEGAPFQNLTLDAEGGVFDFGQEEDDGDGASTREAAAQSAILPEGAQSNDATSEAVDPDPDMATFIKGVQRHMCGERASAREEAEPDQGSETVARTASENLASPAKPDLTVPAFLRRERA